MCDLRLNVWLDLPENYGNRYNGYTWAWRFLINRLTFRVTWRKWPGCVKFQINYLFKARILCHCEANWKRYFKIEFNFKFDPVLILGVTNGFFSSRKMVCLKRWREKSWGNQLVFWKRWWACNHVWNAYYLLNVMFRRASTTPLDILKYLKA